jgi:hypothetical protein
MFKTFTSAVAIFSVSVLAYDPYRQSRQPSYQSKRPSSIKPSTPYAPSYAPSYPGKVQQQEPASRSRYGYGLHEPVKHDPGRKVSRYGAQDPTASPSSKANRFSTPNPYPSYSEKQTAASYDPSSAYGYGFDPYSQKQQKSSPSYKRE